MVIPGYGLGSVDGFNERGLGMHMLYLGATGLAPRDAAKLGIQCLMSEQYILANAATVAEAIALLQMIQLVAVEIHGFNSTLHFAIEDADGDSAIVEFLDGETDVHHGRQYQIMANDPTYDEQLALLAKQDYSKPSMDMALPGNVNAVDRFQRAAYRAAVLPEPENEQEAIAGVLDIARDVFVPFGAPYHEYGIYNTEYRTAFNLTARRYFFELSNQRNVIWSDLSGFDLAAGAPVMVLDPHDIELSGNVIGQFQKAQQVPY